MTLLVNFVSMSVHLRSAKEGPSTMRRTCICRGNEQQSLLLPRVSCPCSSHAEDEYAASRAAKAGSCLVPALVSLSVQIFPTESFIAHTADLSAVIDINLRTVEFRLGEQLTGIGFAPARVDARATQRLHAVGDDALQGQQTCKAQCQA